MVTFSKDWYEEGYDAWWSNDECPYDECTEAYDQWHYGWNDAQVNYDDKYEDTLNNE
jgi:ribosome modulation factor